MHTLEAYSFASKTDTLLGVKDRPLDDVNTCLLIPLDAISNLPDERFDTAGTAIHLVKRNFSDNFGTVISAEIPRSAYAPIGASSVSGPTS